MNRYIQLTEEEKKQIREQYDNNKPTKVSSLIGRKADSGSPCFLCRFTFNDEFFVSFEIKVYAPTEEEAKKEAMMKTWSILGVGEEDISGIEVIPC